MIKQLYKSLGTIFRDIGDQLTYQSARAYLISGRKNYNNGKFKKAINDFNKVIEISRDYCFGMVLVDRALAKHSFKDPEGAEQDLQKAKRLNSCLERISLS